MGTTGGYVFVWREEGFSREETFAALRRVLRDMSHGCQQTYEAEKALMREMVQWAGLPGEMLWESFLRTHDPAAWACWSPDARWLAVNDNVTTEGVEQPEHALAAAERYAKAFKAPCLVCGLYDSDYSTLAYVHPVMGFRTYRLGGRPEGYCEVCGREQRQLPEFLCPFLTEEGEEELIALWLERYLCEEDRLARLARLLGTVLYDREREAPPAGMELLTVGPEELE